MGTVNRLTTLTGLVFTTAMTSTNAQTQYLRAGEAAALLHVSNKTIARWALMGLLPYRLTMGGHRLYPADRIRDLARSLEHETTEEAS